MTDLFPANKLLFNELMRNHTTFKTGGPADIIFLPDCTEDIIHMISVCRDRSLPFVIIGNGSNVLFMDEGYRGVVIKIGKQMEKINLQGDTTIEASTGTTLSKLANFCIDNGLSGLEFVAGIPGTLGGALYMNAGAYGGEMKDCVYSVDVISEELKIKTLTNSMCGFAYRESLIQKEKYIAVSAVLSLKKGDPNEIKTLIKQYNTQRVDKQPIFASAGSTFKRPKGYFAGKLIEDCGLKGYSIGGAQVSEKHAGFVINRGAASSKDICDLISYIQKTVYEKFKIYLETEVQIICNS